MSGVRSAGLKAPFLDTARNGAVWRIPAAAALLAAGIWLLVSLGVDMRHPSAGQLREAVLAHGAWAPLVFLIVFSQPIVPLPASVMLALSGVVFGRSWGPVAGLAGACLRAYGMFGLARLLGRDLVTRLMRGQAAKLDEQLSRHAFKAVLFIRLLPTVPYDMQNYALSFSRVRFPTYALATFLGVIPGAIAYAFLGDSLTGTQQAWKLAAAVALVLAVALVPRLFRPARQNRTITMTTGG